MFKRAACYLGWTVVACGVVGLVVIAIQAYILIAVVVAAASFLTRR